MSTHKKEPSGNATRRQRANPVADQIVRREPRGAVPAPVEYSLTEYGQSVLPLVEIVRMWGHGHIERLKH